MSLSSAARAYMPVSTLRSASSIVPALALAAGALALASCATSGKPADYAAAGCTPARQIYQPPVRPGGAPSFIHIPASCPPARASLGAPGSALSTVPPPVIARAAMQAICRSFLDDPKRQPVAGSPLPGLHFETTAQPGGSRTCTVTFGAGDPDALRAGLLRWGEEQDFRPSRSPIAPGSFAHRDTLCGTGPHARRSLLISTAAPGDRSGVRAIATLMDAAERDPRCDQ